MADLLANWLNNEIELSKVTHPFCLTPTRRVSPTSNKISQTVISSESCCTSSTNNPTSETSRRSNFHPTHSFRDNVQAKLSNFNMLEPTLRNLKIKFDSKTINQIMKGERGAALRLLYQIKMTLEKVYPPTDIAVLRKTGKMGDNQPALKIGSQKEKFDN